MPEVGVGFVAIKPDLQGFGTTLDRGIGPEIDRASGGVSSKFKGMFTSIAALGGGILGAVAVGGFLKGAVAEAQEAAKIGRLTEAVVKSTGGAANVSADQLGKLSERLSNIVAVDDEVIQSAGNVLLTFTNVRNEVGRGNNIFDRTTEAALNMSAALGTDLQSSTMQLGKALNDPVDGMNKLSRAGVQFTDQQKEQVKAMVAAGDTLGAQKIILAEMETQFGGAAKAAADPMERLKVVVGNLQERVGAALLPIIEKASVWLGENLPRALDFLGSAFGKVKEFVQPVIDILFFKDFKGGPFSEDSKIVDVLFRIRDAFDTVKRVVGEFWYTLTSGFSEQDTATPAETMAFRVRDGFTALLDIGKQVAGWITGTLWPAIKNIVDAVGGWGNALKIVGIAIAAFVAPIATLAAGLIYAYTHFEGFRNVVDAVVQFITGTVVPAVTALASGIVDQLGKAVAWVQEMWPQISEAIGHVMNAVQTVVETVLAVVQRAWQLVGDDVLRIAKTVFGFVQDTVKNAMEFIQGIIKTVLALINGDWGRAWDGIKQALSAVWEQIQNVVTTAIDLVKSGLGAAMSTIGAAWDVAWTAIKDAAGAVLTAVVEFVTGLPQRAKDALSAAWTTFSEFWSSVFQAVVDFVSARITDVVTWFTELPQKIVDTVTLGFEKLKTLGGDIVGTVFDGLKALATGVGGLWEWWTNLPETIISTVGEGFSKLLQLGKDIVGKIVEGIKNVVGDIGGAILDGVKGIGGGVLDAIGIGDGPGRPRTAAGTGTTLGRVKRVMGAGLYVTSTYRTPAENAAVGGSPTSYHLDKRNPAVDVGGPVSALDALHARLVRMGGWRELLWRTKGHWDHLHVAHDGGMVSPAWPTVPGLRSDERPAVLQVGEQVLSRAEGGEIISELRGIRTELRQTRERALTLARTT